MGKDKDELKEPNLEWREDTKRWRVRFKLTNPDGKQEDIRITLDKGISKGAARKIRNALLTAVKFYDHRYLSTNDPAVYVSNYSRIRDGHCLQPSSIP